MFTWHISIVANSIPVYSPEWKVPGRPHMPPTVTHHRQCYRMCHSVFPHSGDSGEMLYATVRINSRVSEWIMLNQFEIWRWYSLQKLPKFNISAFDAVGDQTSNSHTLTGCLKPWPLNLTGLVSKFCNKLYDQPSIKERKWNVCFNVTTNWWPWQPAFYALRVVLDERLFQSWCLVLGFVSMLMLWGGQISITYLCPSFPLPSQTTD